MVCTCFYWQHLPFLWRHVHLSSINVPQLGSLKHQRISIIWFWHLKHWMMNQIFTWNMVLSPFPSIKTWQSGWFQICYYFSPLLFWKWSNLTSIFFKWVVQPPTRWLFGVLGCFFNWLASSSTKNHGKPRGPGTQSHHRPPEIRLNKALLRESNGK